MFAVTVSSELEMKWMMFLVPVSSMNIIIAKYTCHVNDRFCTSIRVSLLYTKSVALYPGSPGRPLNVNVLRASSYSLTLDWDSPQSNGGRTDVSYSIEYQHTSLLFEGFLTGGNVASGSSRQLTLNGLNPVSEYTIRSVIRSSMSYIATNLCNLQN